MNFDLSTETPDADFSSKLHSLRNLTKLSNADVKDTREKLPVLTDRLERWVRLSTAFSALPLTRLLEVLSLYCQCGFAEDLFDHCVTVLGALLAQSAKRNLRYILATLSLVEGLCSVDTKWEKLFQGHVIYALFDLLQYLAVKEESMVAVLKTSAIFLQLSAAAKPWASYKQLPELCNFAFRNYIGVWHLSDCVLQHMPQTTRNWLGFFAELATTLGLGTLGLSTEFITALHQLPPHLARSGRVSVWIAEIVGNFELKLPSQEEHLNREIAAHSNATVRVLGALQSKVSDTISAFAGRPPVDMHARVTKLLAEIVEALQSVELQMKHCPALATAVAEIHRLRHRLSQAEMLPIELWSPSACAGEFRTLIINPVARVISDITAGEASAHRAAFVTLTREAALLRLSPSLLVQPSWLQRALHVATHTWSPVELWAKIQRSDANDSLAQLLLRAMQQFPQYGSLFATASHVLARVGEPSTPGSGPSAVFSSSNHVDPLVDVLVAKMQEPEAANTDLRRVLHSYASQAAGLASSEPSNSHSMALERTFDLLQLDRRATRQKIRRAFRICFNEDLEELALPDFVMRIGKAVPDVCMYCSGFSLFGSVLGLLENPLSSLSSCLSGVDPGVGNAMKLLISQHKGAKDFLHTAEEKITKYAKDASAITGEAMARLAAVADAPAAARKQLLETAGQYKEKALSQLSALRQRVGDHVNSALAEANKRIDGVRGGVADLAKPLLGKHPQVDLLASKVDNGFLKAKERLQQGADTLNYNVDHLEKRLRGGIDRAEEWLGDGLDRVEKHVNDVLKPGTTAVAKLPLCNYADQVRNLVKPLKKLAQNVSMRPLYMHGGATVWDVVNNM